MLNSGRNTVEIASGRVLLLPVAAGKLIWEGSIVAINKDGYAIPAEKSAGLRCAGRAEVYIDNRTGADGDARVSVRRGIFKYNNDSANPVTDKDILKNCFIFDDETVTMLETDSSVAGKVIGIDESEVIVEIL